MIFYATIRYDIIINPSTIMEIEVDVARMARRIKNCTTFCFAGIIAAILPKTFPLNVF